MRAQVVSLTRRPNGSVAKRVAEVEGEAIRFGRGTSNEVLLPDVRIGLSEAELRIGDRHLTVNRVGTGTMRVNGADVTAAAVKVGDKVQLGPYEAVLVEPPPGFDAALTLELVAPLGDDLERLKRSSSVGLTQTALSKRRIAWAAFFLVFALFFIVPLVVFHTAGRSDPKLRDPATHPIAVVANRSWNVGEISNAHKNFAVNCQSCHAQPFSRVKDDTCLTCHGAVRHHLDVGATRVAMLEEQRCASCHEEHQGPRGTVLRAEALCADCHGDLKKVAASTTVANVADFENRHPEFRVTVVADAKEKKTVRVALDPNQKPVDKPNLKMTHKAHLMPVGWPRGMAKLECASCHKPDSGGVAMLPITFREHCASCHENSLKFDVLAGERSVPHGDAIAAQRYVQDYYGRVALEGGVADAAAPEVVQRRRVGRPLEPEERLEALAWAQQRARQARDFIFDDKRGCGTCHTVDRSDELYRIEPVLLLKSFLPRSQFTHDKHRAVPCGDCHGAAESNASSDVLIPGIANCQGCHGGEKSSSKVQSTCVSCHEFHRHDLGPMRPKPAAALAIGNQPAAAAAANEEQGKQ